MAVDGQKSLPSNTPIPKYIAVKNGKEKPEYLDPTLEPILKETYGVMTYQEDVMNIARELAGYSLGEADLLRRATHVCGQRLGHRLDDHDLLRSLAGQPRHAVNDAVDEGDPAVCAVDLERDRPAGRQGVGPEVRVGARSLHQVQPTVGDGRHKPQSCR